MHTSLDKIGQPNTDSMCDYSLIYGWEEVSIFQSIFRKYKDILEEIMR